MKIRNKLIVYFLIVLLVPVSILSFVLLRNSQANLEDQITNRLNILADHREAQIEDFFRRTTDIVNVIANGALLSERVSQYENDPTPALQSTLTNELAVTLHAMKGKELETLSLIDTSGKTIVSTDKNMLGENVSAEPFFSAGKSAAGVYFVRSGGAVSLSFVAPILHDGHVVGVIRGTTPIDTLTGIVHNTTGLGQTGEVLFAIPNADGSPHFVVNRLFERKTIPAMESKISMNNALKGEEKVMSNTTDYRGVQVVAVTRYMKDEGAGLVVKFDRSEVNAPLTNVRITTLVVFLFAVLLAIIVAWFLARTFSDPLEELTEVTKNVSKYNLDVPLSDNLLKSSGEIGMLSRTFQSMMNTLSHTYEELKELDKLKDDFLFVTTHELKSPLVPIKAQAQLLLAGKFGELTQKQKDAIEMIHRNEEVLNALASEVLDISKIKSNQLKLIFERINMAKLIAEAVEDIHPLAERKHLEMHVSLPQEDFHIMADGTRMRQVVMNLLDNAIKFTPEGGSVSIEARAEEIAGQRQLVVVVKDTGVGLSKKSLSQLFTPFFQAHQDVESRQPGTGLGLAIAKGIVEAHGGTIRVESAGEGKGSAFTFHIPFITLSINK